MTVKYFYYYLVFLWKYLARNKYRKIFSRNNKYGEIYKIFSCKIFYKRQSYIKSNLIFWMFVKNM
jgi:hypothetical protein